MWGERATIDPMVERDGWVAPGDLLKIERRYLVNGVVTKVTDKGTFQGVQLVGSVEHMVLEDSRRKEVRLLPIPTISQITLVKALPREPAPEAPTAPARIENDPSIA